MSPTSPRRRISWACGSPRSTRSPDSLDGRGPPVVVAGAVALAEAVPDASLRPGGFALVRGEEVDLDVSASSWWRPGTSASTRWRTAASSRCGATSWTSSRRLRIAPPVSSCSATRSSRSAGSRRSPSVLWATPSGSSSRLRPSSRWSTASSPRSRSTTRGPSRPDLADLLPLNSLRAPLDLLERRRGGPDRRRRGDRAGAARPLAGRDRGDPRRGRAAPLRRRRPAARRAGRASPERHRLGARSSSYARRRPARRLARSPRPRASWRRSFARDTAWSLPSITSGEAERTRYNLQRLESRDARPQRPPEGLAFAEARITDGFVAPELKLAVFPFRRLVHGRRAAAAPAVRGRFAAAVDLRVGDYVVHEDHGIARFAGFETKTVGDVTRDYLELEYRGEDKVFAPTDQLAKISRYVGAGGDAPAALGARLEALGRRQVEGQARGPRARGRVAQPLRGAQGAHGPRVRGRLRLGAGAAALVPVSRDGRPARGDRGRVRRHGGRRGRWTA